MPRIHFQQQLAELKDKILAMAALSQQAVAEVHSEILILSQDARNDAIHVNADLAQHLPD